MSAADISLAPAVPGLDDDFDPLAVDDGDITPDEYVHIRVQQRNGRKCLTTVQGLDKSFDKKRILKALKKVFCCNGCIVDDEKLGQVIQLQGDQRKNVQQFFIDEGIVKKELLKIHGF